MTVYVDNAQIEKGRQTLCHMFADTDQELHTIARLIGARKHRFKYPKTPQRHYLITVEMRARAIARDAVLVNKMEAAWMIHHRENHGRLPTLTRKPAE